MNSNFDVVRGIYRAFAAGDIPSVLGALSPIVQWTEAAGGPYGGVSNGPDAVLENVFMKIGAEWDGFAAVPAECIADGATVVALGEYGGTYKVTGKSFNAPLPMYGSSTAARPCRSTSTRTRPCTCSRCRRSARPEDSLRPIPPRGQA